MRRREFIALFGGAGASPEVFADRLRAFHQGLNRQDTRAPRATDAPCSRGRGARISDFLLSQLVCFWHKADMPITLRNVRFGGESGHWLEMPAMSAFDPKRTSLVQFCCDAEHGSHSTKC